MINANANVICNNSIQYSFKDILVEIDNNFKLYSKISLTPSNQINYHKQRIAIDCASQTYFKKGAVYLASDSHLVAECWPHKASSDKAYSFACKGMHEWLISLFQCAQPFNRKKQNPKEKLEKQTKIPCDFKQSGCTWLFGSAQLEDHLEECKFRPYRCIIDELDVKP